MACERPPACRFAPRLSPFVRGTLPLVGLLTTLKPGPVSPLRRGTAAERSDRQGVAHEPCLPTAASHTKIAGTRKTFVQNIANAESNRTATERANPNILTATPAN